ncbi:helicase HerA domain-containing protein [Natronorubrum sp. FCH18a]|uniref:helicase HerA domain-containing protein n=1 Tax=Natronorubrum sp. FCH18a TaxID=3447018 RepID=UPI003F51A9B9
MESSTHPSQDETTGSNEHDERITVGADGYDLPVVDVLTGRGFITGKSGSGKSNTASVVIEQLLANGFPCLIVDTDGEYYGLKERFEMLHVGADEECDLQVSPEHAEKLAEFAIEQNIPIILDVSGYLDTDDANALIRETARHLFTKEKKLKKPFLLVVEEIHEYVPESSGLDDTGQMLVKIGKRGRKHGLGIVGISQRPADVKKDFITQANWLVWHRLTWENDTKVVGRVADTEYRDRVPDLQDGEAFVQADWNMSIDRVQFKRKRTFDAGATPGLEEFERPDLKSVSEDLVDDLEEISDREQRRQDRVAQLERTVEARDERIEELEQELENARDMTDMAQQFTQALTSAADGDAESGETIQQQVDEIREQKNEEIRRLRSERDQLQDRVDNLESTVTDQADRIRDLEQYEQAVENLEELREGVARMADALSMDVDGGSEKYRQKLERKDERIDELEAAITKLEQQGYSLNEEFTEKMDFLRHEAVREEIDRAASKTRTKDEHTWDVLSVLVDQDEATTKQITAFVDVSKSSVRSILSKLKDQHVVHARKRGKTPHYSLNVEGMKQIIQQRRKREEMAELKDRVKS